MDKRRYAFGILTIGLALAACALTSYGWFTHSATKCICIGAGSIFFELRPDGTQPYNSTCLLYVDDMLPSEWVNTSVDIYNIGKGGVYNTPQKPYAYSRGRELKYCLYFSNMTETVPGFYDKLDIKIYRLWGAYPGGGVLWYQGKLGTFCLKRSKLTLGSTDRLVFSIHINETAGNEFQLANCKLQLNVVASQLNDPSWYCVPGLISVGPV